MSLSNEFVEQFTTFYKNLKIRIDLKAPSQETQKILNNSINWIFTLSAVTLLWVLNSISNFSINDLLINKSIYILIISVFCLSSVLLGLFRLNIFLKDFIRDTTKEKLFSTPDRLKIDRKNLDPSEVIEEMEKDVESFFITYDKVTGILKPRFKLLFLGIGLYLVGLIILGFYIINYIDCYL